MSTPDADRVLTPEASQFVAGLHRRFNPRRLDLLAARTRRQARFDAGERPDFLPETLQIRTGDWTVPEAPKALADRRVEITGPVERKMMINALNSGAQVFMADFEDANSPTWDNVIAGQVNLQDAVRGTIEVATPDKTYRLDREPAVLAVRPRGWHLPEKHFQVDGDPVSASLFDFGLHVFHNGREALSRGSGPYFYLPKLESHLEARLWNDVMFAAEDTLGLERGSIRATVLIETITAAFEMHEILYELRDHACGLNAGRWDYIFSVAKRFHADPAFVLPDRSSVTMTAPFMRAFSELLVQTCHLRGAHAIGGMSAFIPNRRKPDVTEAALAKVSEDKRREAADGFDGTWVAHPDLVAPGSIGIRRRARRPPQPAGPPAPRRAGDRGRLARRQATRRRDHPGRSGHQHLGRPALPGVVVVRHRSRRHRRPHGGRRHRRDQPGPDLAVGPPSGHPG